MLLRVGIGLALMAGLCPGGTEVWNLGELGAEGKAVKAPPKEWRLPQGASAIEVVTVHAAGLAKDAGLAAGDVIVGLGGAPMLKKTEPVYQLVDYLETTAASNKPEASLAVRRAGKPETILVALPAAPAHAASCPVSCARCDALVEESMAALAALQRADGGFAFKLSGITGETVVTCLAGLAFLANGSTPDSGVWAGNIRKATAFVMKHAGKLDAWMPDGKVDGKNYNATNWALAWGSLYLAEIQRLAPAQEQLDRMTEWMQAIEKNQELSGGWGHGPGGVNGTGYLELQASGNVQLAALGALRRSGLKPSKAVIDRGLLYLNACVTAEGGVRYGSDEKYWLGEPGRNAGALWALALLEQQKHPMQPKLAAWFRKNLAEVPEGHASPVFHLTNAAFASHHLGDAAWKEYASRFRLEFLASRRPDGTYAARPTRESVAQKEEGTDDFVGPAWATAAHLVIVQLRRGNLKVLAGAK
ncbi:MAG: hypothetical protein HYY18_06045 [Planctomycetes bacterium]|nr:hypothetical protein [Planctomycetota bacterium]